MIFLPYFNFENTLPLFAENLSFEYDYFQNFTVINYYDWLTFSNSSFVNLFSDSFTPNSLELFIENTEDLSYFSNLENVTSLYHYSIPNTKLAYPEPFIASASFMHSDLWFVHILIYQYWLWFVFIFIIIFFFITFICTVRWCNMRIRPRRETRGVSRSKCGDLITACVPVSWATSIIVNESTDAIDYFDGFGTTELVIGIRAYQWGWEYYYPKDLDLNYNIKHSYSSFIGNSLKYNKTSDLSLKANNLWKFYQNKISDQIITPAHLLVLPADNLKILNNLNFGDVGTNSLVESNAFKKIKSFSKNNSAKSSYSRFDYNNKYEIFSKLNLSNNEFCASTLYGIKRQHNFLNNQSAVNGLTPFSSKSLTKLINTNYEFQTSPRIEPEVTNLFNLKDYKTSDSLNFILLFQKFISQAPFSNFKKLSFFTETFFLLNNDSDKKKSPKLILKNNLILKLDIFNNKIFFQNFSSEHYNAFNVINKWKNNNAVTKLFESFSTNQALATNEKFLRKNVNIKLSKSNLNLSNNINLLKDYNDYLANQVNNSLFIYNNSKGKWFNFELLNKLGANKIYLNSPFSPISSNNLTLNSIEYDNCGNSINPGIPTVLQGKEDSLPNYLVSIYWNSLWSNTSFNHRLSNNLIFLKFSNFFYMPFFNFYYDYDFRNWQSIELLEDSIWETIFPSNFFDEYQDLTENFYNYNLEKKLLKNYFLFDKNFKFSDNVIDNPFSISNNGLFNDSLFSIFIEDTNSNNNLSPLHNFHFFPVINSLTNFDDSFDFFKNTLFLQNNFNLINLSLNSSFVSFFSSTQIFDMFRSNYEDLSWINDNLTRKLSPVFHINKNEFYQKMSYQKFRLNNQINLRSTVKNSMVNHNALQKVFKSRFDDGRSNTKLFDLAFINSKQPYLTSTRPVYEKLLGKNKESFFKGNYYKNNFTSNINLSGEVSGSLNFYFFDFPFLLAQKSDASRYLWFDWFSRWGFYEVQPASSSKYAIYGMPYYNKFFDFNSEQNDSLNETETYFVRLAKTRKNYLSSWSHSPYFYAKNTIFNKSDLIFNLYSDNLLTGLSRQLEATNCYWKEINFTKNSSFKFSPSLSSINSYAKTTWQPTAGASSYFYHLSTINDILTKREYMYRQFFSNSNKLINLPTLLTNSPRNTLLSEIKTSFNFIDPILINNEYSKDIYYNSLEYFNFNIFKSVLGSNARIKSFYFFLFSNQLDKSNEILLKNQFRPLRKGINNMLRLHATGAVAMPIEIRLQILASSKDVIHSWAIPSAGIKIDCVPGYSSHKVMIFLVSGIFWGQCMEICGRYHHWMPIVVYFMKRDLFFLWCSHFIFLSGSNNIWTINDKQFVDYIRAVSYDKNTWISEIY